MKTKKLQLITVSLFILSISIMTIGLILIGISNVNYIHINWSSKLVLRKSNGFNLLKYISIIYILNHSANFICLINRNYELYYNWIQLQIGVIFCVILVPIFSSITMSLIFLIIGLKIKLKNNNFWDAIQNCEIIYNYYIH